MIIKSDNKIDIITSYMDDIDGDGIMDIVILPGMTNTYRNISGSMKYFKGLKKIPKQGHSSAVSNLLCSIDEIC